MSFLGISVLEIVMTRHDMSTYIVMLLYMVKMAVMIEFLKFQARECEWFLQSVLIFHLHSTV